MLKIECLTEDRGEIEKWVTHFTRVTPGHLNSRVQGGDSRTVEGETLASEKLDRAWCANIDIYDCIGLSVCQIVGLVQMSIDGCFTDQKPYFSVSCI